MHNRGPATFKEYSRSDFTLIPLIIQMFALKKPFLSCFSKRQVHRYYYNLEIVPI